MIRNIEIDSLNHHISMTLKVVSTFQGTITYLSKDVVASGLRKIVRQDV